MKITKVLSGAVGVLLSSALLCAPAFAGPGGGHGGGHGGHSTHSGYKSSYGKSSRASHYAGAKRASYHAKSGFKSTHVSRFAQSRGSRPAATSEHLVSGYYRRDGQFVKPYFATNADSTRNNNYSTRGNINPHTGQAGTKPRDGE